MTKKGFKTVYKNTARLIISSLISDAKQKKFDSVEEINNAVDAVIELIEDSREEIIQKHKESSKCNHVYNKPNFSVQRRIFGYVTVYERSCSKCGYKETQTEETDGVPEWGKDAEKRYHNNMI